MAYEISVGLAIVYSIISIVLLILWVMTLIAQARRSHWGWFVFTLLFPIIMFVYWINRLVSKKKY